MNNSAESTNAYRHTVFLCSLSALAFVLGLCSMFLTAESSWKYASLLLMAIGGGILGASLRKLSDLKRLNR